jgi:DNA replication protein DnaC
MDNNYEKKTNYSNKNLNFVGADFYLDRFDDAFNITSSSPSIFNPELIDSPKQLSPEDEYKKSANTFVNQLRISLSELVSNQLATDVPPFFKVPEKYKDVSFEGIKTPSKTQKKLIKLLQLALEGHKELSLRDSCSPNFSIYVHGPVGVGKTHICSAYLNALRCKVSQEIERKKYYWLSDMSLAREVKNSLSRAYEVIDKYDRVAYSRNNFFLSSEIRSESEVMEDLSKLLGDKDFVNDAVATVENSVHQFLLYDVAFLEFERIFNVYQRDKKLIESLIKPRVLLIDDLHPKGNIERAKLIQDLLEVRYNQKGGVTIVTSNLAPEELMGGGGYDAKILQRLLSRCDEMFLMFDISDTSDYRKFLGTEKRKRIEKLLD